MAQHSPLITPPSAALTRDDILAWFASGEKTRDAWGIGTEHEKFLFDCRSHRRPPYDGADGIEGILTRIAGRAGWRGVYEAGKIIAVKHSDGSSITLEPGGQMELSGAIMANVHQTCSETQNHLRLMSEVIDQSHIWMLGLGFDPKWRREDIAWMPKGRYAIMRRYMPKVGTKGLDMMLRTCTIQVNLDYASEADMAQKFRTALALQPIATALFANSPFVEGKPSGVLSNRAMAWADTDAARCGVPEVVFDAGFGYEAWLDYVLDVPMYFLERDGGYVDVAGESFREFMRGELAGFPGEYPSLADWEAHTTTVFPEVRLKRFLEMRGADGGDWTMICGLPALWTGILYDDEALAAAAEFAGEFGVEEVRAGFLSAAQDGLAGRIGGYALYEAAERLLGLALAGLQRRQIVDKHGADETQYLTPIKKLLAQRTTPAEVLLAEYRDGWGENIDRIYDTHRLQPSSATQSTGT